MTDQPDSNPGVFPHVLFVIPQLDPGGSEGQLVELLERVYPTCVSASVAALRPAKDMRLTERLRAIGLVPYVLSRSDDRRLIGEADAARRVAGLLRRLRPDAVYAWLEEAALVSAPIARCFRTPVLVARRNVSGAAAERFAAMRLAIRHAERLGAIVTGNSDSVVEEAIRRGVRRERVRLVANGHAPIPALPMPEREGVALGYVAHFRSDKGHLRLLDTLTRVRATTPWRVDLAGGGGLADYVRSVSARHGLDGRVSFIGPIDDPRRFWEDRDAAVLFSDYEGSPNALIEAAMAGRPMVATDSGGTRDVVASGTGFLVPVDDPARGAEALSQLIDDRKLRERMGAAAHEHVVEHFSVERFVEGHLAAIDEAVSNPGHRI